MAHVILATIVGASDEELRLAFVPGSVPRETLLLKLYAGDLTSAARRPRTASAILAVAHRFLYPLGSASLPQARTGRLTVKPDPITV